MKKLTIVNEFPEKFLEINYRDIKEIFDSPTLVHLKGDKEPALFISIMLHGNEYSGLLIMQEILKKYQKKGSFHLPRSIWLFVGNVEAAFLGLRRQDNELDFNRAWPGTPHPDDLTSKLITEVMAKITEKELFAAIDLHNNTGTNPPYGCISVVNEKNKYLSSLFNHIGMVFHTPKGVSTMAFDDICPAITLECSTPGNTLGIEKAVSLIDDLMHMDHFPEKTLPEHDLQLVQNNAVLKIAEDVTFGFEEEQEAYELTLIDNFDRHNFTRLEQGEVFAHTTISRPLIATAEDGTDITDDIIKNDNGALSLKKALMPAMITLDKKIILQDCLCYLLEDYEKTY
ncbi:M14 family metallopeptidase [Sulfurovum sp. zt1-1]|uniref:M14 family metallopeptidase n=1 Tax=Sulfurovum zhangzhouensis TaxID=3019067 RepID=A0ABT7QV51_9BACT|nr:M14 family metallopeptidase [Sulfurovum zhangzhouensis]MDM5270715.1 M14 family metallopeptidase [Sulfurovum zhangzhouensis]